VKFKINESIEFLTKDDFSKDTFMIKNTGFKYIEYQKKTKK